MWQIDRDILRIFLPSSGERFIDSINNRAPFFALTVAYTDTVQLPGISGAGVSEELRELTAQADAENLAAPDGDRHVGHGVEATEPHRGVFDAKTIIHVGHP